MNKNSFNLSSPLQPPPAYQHSCSSFCLLRIGKGKKRTKLQTLRKFSRSKTVLEYTKAGGVMT